MKLRMVAFILGAAALVAPACAQTAASPFPLPTPIEKELGTRAANVTEVTLGKGMLDFAAKFMDKNDKDQAAVKQLIDGLDGIYVRSYEFDKEGQYSMDEIATVAPGLRDSRVDADGARAREQGRGDHRRDDEDGQRRAAGNFCAGCRAEGADHRAHPRPHPHGSTERTSRA